jgi:hypothetical protein
MQLQQFNNLLTAFLKYPPTNHTRKCPLEEPTVPPESRSIEEHSAKISYSWAAPKLRFVKPQPPRPFGPYRDPSKTDTVPKRWSGEAPKPRLVKSRIYTRKEKLILGDNTQHNTSAVNAVKDRVINVEGLDEISISTKNERSEATGLVVYDHLFDDSRVQTDAAKRPWKSLITPRRTVRHQKRSRPAPPAVLLSSWLEIENVDERKQRWLEIRDYLEPPSPPTILLYYLHQIEDSSVCFYLNKIFANCLLTLYSQQQVCLNLVMQQKYICREEASLWMM